MQTNTPTSHHSVFYRPDALPDAQPTASMHWRTVYGLSNSSKCLWRSFSYCKSFQVWYLVFVARRAVPLHPHSFMCVLFSADWTHWACVYCVRLNASRITTYGSCTWYTEIGWSRRVNQEHRWSDSCGTVLISTHWTIYTLEASTGHTVAKTVCSDTHYTQTALYNKLYHHHRICLLDRNDRTHLHK